MTFAIQNRSFPEIVGNGRFQFCSEKWNCPIRGCHFLENWFVKTHRSQKISHIFDEPIFQKVAPPNRAVPFFGAELETPISNNFWKRAVLICKITGFSSDSRQGCFHDFCKSKPLVSRNCWKWAFPILLRKMELPD